MEDHGWSQTRMGRELGVSQSWVSRVANGILDPGTRTASSLLAKVGWELRIMPKPEEDDPVKRREFVTGAASALFIPPPKTTPFHDPSYVDLLTQRMAEAHYAQGGDSQIMTLIGQGRKIQSAAISGGRALQSAASDFMRFGSYVFHQAGRADIGARFANNALHLATEARNSDKQASAYFALSIVNGFNGNESSLDASAKTASRAVMFAQRGLRIPGIGDEPRAYLYGFLACGLANVPGNERQARSAIDRALNINAVPAIDRADIVGIVGNALRDIGERREALRTFEETVRLHAPYSPFLQARYLGDQIMLAFDMREPSLAASLMNTLSYMLPMVDSTVVDRQVAQMLRASRPWSAVPEVRDARERLQSVRTTPPPHPGHERP